MYIDLVDALRCPRPHPSTWLVAAAVETRARCVIRGTLGCPVCEAEFPIEDGVAELGGDAPTAGAGSAGDVADGELTMRLAAFLDLATPGGIIAVGPAWDRALDPLLDVVDLRALVLDPVAGWRPRPPFGAVRGGGVPVAAGALRGVALDVRTADEVRLAAAVRALAPRGRLLAPATAPLPDGVRELARDATHWVAEREGALASPVVQLRRGS
jgi:uncharacterized protein YbaR (Trm112 family)